MDLKIGLLNLDSHAQPRGFSVHRIVMCLVFENNK
jgi:hypothetical protein